MSDQNGDSGSKDRATVALAVAKIDALKELTAFGFEEVHRRLDAVEGLPERVTRLEERPSASPERMTRIEERVSVLEKAREQVRVHWPSLIPALLAVGIAAAALFL